MFFSVVVVVVVDVIVDVVVVVGVVVVVVAVVVVVVAVIVGVLARQQILLCALKCDFKTLNHISPSAVSYGVSSLLIFPKGMVVRWCKSMYNTTSRYPILVVYLPREPPHSCFVLITQSGVAPESPSSVPSVSQISGLRITSISRLGKKRFYRDTVRLSPVEVVLLVAILLVAASGAISQKHTPGIHFTGLRRIV